MRKPTLKGFDNPVHAVVQGASRGLGLAFVRQLVERDNVERILATCRNPSNADELQSLADDSPDRLHITALDVTDEQQISQAADVASDKLGHFDLLLNVAGVLHDKSEDIRPEKKLDDVDPDATMRAFRVNSLGPLLVLKHFSSLIRRDRRCVVANLSARVGSIGDNHLGGWYSYRASKAAQNMFTRTAAIELGRHRRTGDTICVALHPGTVDTELSKPFRSNIPEDQVFPTQRAARQLLDVIGNLDPDDSGQFFDWAGEPVQW